MQYGLSHTAINAIPRNISNLSPKGLVRVFAVILGSGEQVAMHPPVVLSCLFICVCILCEFIIFGSFSTRIQRDMC